MTPLKLAAAIVAIITLTTIALIRCSEANEALHRAYQLNGNKMCCGSIDVSDDPVLHPELSPPPVPSFADRVLVPPPIVHKRQKLMHRTEIARDICTVHGMHKVFTQGKNWRCRK